MSFSSSSRKIASNLLLRGGEILRNPLVEVDHTGRIISVESGVEAVDREPTTEFYSGIMLAGFINAHCHLELSYLQNMMEPHAGFHTFASRIGAVRNTFTTEQRLSAMQRADLQMWHGGVAAVGDISNGMSSYEIKGESKIHYHTFAEVFGLNRVDYSNMEELLTMPNTSLTPHSTYSLNDNLFREIVAHHPTSPLSIHFMESDGEADLFNGCGYLDAWYKSAGYEYDFDHYGSPAERLVASTESNRSLLLIHNCCVTQRDIDIIMGHFTAPIYWVVCPRSNEYISSLRPPLELLRRNGLNICVGTDSLASNYSLDMVEELRAMGDVPLVERLDWATRQGAAALQLDDFGDIEVGKRGGVNILSAIDYTPRELTEKSRIRRIL